MIPRVSRGKSVLVVLILILYLLPCISVLSQESDKVLFKNRRDRVDISNVELRLGLTDFFIRFTEQVEQVADKIYYESNDSEVKRAALMWKIYGISAMGKAVNMPDEIASFYNAWPMAKQMIHFFEDRKGSAGPFC